MAVMSEPGEQGMAPQDPADQAGIGGGLVPDDQEEGYEQVEQLLQRQETESDETGPDETGDARNR